jgi:hypothetical protein
MCKAKQNLRIAHIAVAVGIVAVLMRINASQYTLNCKVLLICFILLAIVLAQFTNMNYLRSCVFLSSFYCVLPLFSLYATWLAAWIHLSRFPEPNTDDPAMICSYVRILRTFTFIFLEFVPSMCVICILSLAGCWVSSLIKGRMCDNLNLRLSAISLGIWSTFFLVLRLDPGFIVYWFFD